MYTPEDIQRCFDTATLTYLQNKNRGGTSGQKGTRYEDYFTVYKLAQLAKEILEAELAVYFSSQIIAFVDDLVIDIALEPLQHYQLKNSAHISWSSGDNSIQDDFAKQHRLNRETLARDSKLSLVVSDKSCSERLRAAIPPLIQAFSEVQHFPYDPNIMMLIEQTPAFRENLVYLSAFEQPEPDKVEYVAKALIGAWITCCSSNTSGHELLTKAQRQSPQYIRSFQAEVSLEPEVEKILCNIEDFKYNLAKGFLHWDYADGLQSGTPPYSIDTDEFRRLQERIKKHRPTTFEELENLL